MKQDVEKNKKLMIFIGYMDDPLSCATSLESISASVKPEDRNIISMNTFSVEQEKALGVKITHFEKLLEDKDYKYMENYALSLSENWREYFFPGKNVIKFNGIDMGKISHLDIYTHLITAIRNLHVILNGIMKNKPAEIMLIGEKIEDELGGITAFLRSTLKIKTSHIKIHNKKPYISLHKFVNGTKRFITNAITEILDKSNRAYLANNKRYKNAILVDYRLRGILDGIGKGESIINFVIEKGLRLRLNFIKKRRPYFSFRETYSLANNKGMPGHSYRINDRARDNFAKIGNPRYKNYCIYGVLENIFRRFTNDKLYLARNSVRKIYHFFRSVKPKIVILRDSVRTEECALTLTAKRLNIHTLIIQHGLETIKNIYSKQNADSIAFWGTSHAKWFKSFGTDISKSKITGNPFHDSIYRGSYGRIERYKIILRNINADPKKPTMVYLGNAIRYYPSNSVYVRPDLSLYSLRITVNAFRKFKDAQLLVKLHPYYTRGKYFTLFKEIASQFSNVFILENTNIPDLFIGSKAVITELFSTAALDAVIMRKPVIFYNFLKTEQFVPFEKRGVALGIRRPDELGITIEKMLYNKDKIFFREENVDNFIRDYAHKIDGQSSSRVKKFIRELMSK